MPGSAAPAPVRGEREATPASSLPPTAVDPRKDEYEKWRKERSARNDNADAYLALNEGDLMAAIVDRLSILEPPRDPAIQWIGSNLGPHVREAFLGALAGRDLSRVLDELLHPADPRYLIDRHRPLAEGTAGNSVDGNVPVGPLFWRADIGFATALEAELRLRESLTRMIRRFAVQIEGKHPAVVTPADLVTSHPMDRVAARILCDERIVKPVAPQKGKKQGGKSDAKGEFRDGIRFLGDYRWMGAEDPSMWNWIEVKEPRDATAEDVAATLWLGAHESQRAYALVGSAPFFRIPPEWAEQFGSATEHRPKDTRAEDGPEANSALVLAESAYATDVAIAQAAPERKFDKRGIPLAPDLKKLPQLLDQSWRQLERVRDHLKADGLWELVLPALSWVGKHREHVLSIPDHRLIALTPVIEGQQVLLFEAVGAVAELAKMQASDPSGSVTAVMRDYAIAIGESHLLTPARTQLEKAKAAKAELPLRLLDQSAHDTRNSIEAQRSNETNLTLGAEASSNHVAALDKQIGDMRARRAAGLGIDPDDALLVSAELKEEAVVSRARSIFLHLDNLSTLGSASMAAEIQGVAAELKLTIVDRHPITKATKVRGIDPRFKKDIAEATNAATSATDDALTAFLAKAKLDTKIPEWIEMIEARERKLRAFQIAGMIMLLVGSSMAGNFAGGVVAAAVRGTLLADAATAAVGVTWGVRIANATGAVAGLATDAAINAGVQVGVSGGSLSDGFADNMLGNAAMRVALAPLHKATAAWGGSGKEIANLGIWERNILRGKTLLKGSAVLTAEMITAAAVNYVVHRARHGAPPDEATAMEWAIQGASMAIGKFMGRWTHDFEARITGLVERGAHLRARAANMRKLAAKVEETGDKDEAMKLLVERHDALEEEAKIVHELAATGKLSAQTAETMTVGNQADRGAVAGESFKTMPLRLQGLQPDDASGTVWTGGRDDISIALHQAEKSGLEVRVLAHDTAARQWKIRLGGDELTIIETKPTETKADADHGTSANAKADKRSHEARAFMEQKWAALRPPTSVDEARQRRAGGESWSNQQVREYYNRRNGEIGPLNEQWKQQGLSAAERAHMASELRHEMRMVAREMMSNDGDRLEVLFRDATEYGDGGGPTFEQTLAKQRGRGLEGDAAYEAIIGSSQRTDPKTNARVAKGETQRVPVELPPGTQVRGDRIIVTAMSGEQLTVFVKRGSGSDPVAIDRNPDGTFNLTFGPDVPREVVIRQAARDLRTWRRHRASPRAISACSTIKPPLRRNSLATSRGASQTNLVDRRSSPRS